LPNTGWYSEGNGQFTNIAVAANENGRLEIFSYESVGAGRIFHKWQTHPNGGWVDWSPFGVVKDRYYFNEYLNGHTDLFVGIDAQSRLQLVTQGDWTIGQKSMNGIWGDWHRIQSSGMPDSLLLTGMARSIDGRLYVFGVDQVALDVRYSEQDSGGSWSDWRNFGHPTDGDGEAFVAVRLDDWVFRSGFARWRAPNLGVGCNQDGRIEIYGASPLKMWHRWQSNRSKLSEWVPWEPLGTPQPRIDNLADWTVIQNEDGRLEVFAAGTDGTNDQIWHIWQGDPNGGWGTWDPLPGLFLSPLPKPQPTSPLKGALRAARTVDGRLKIFAIGQGGGLFTQTQIGASGVGGWESGWESLGGENITAFDVGQNADGRLEVFIVSSGSVWHRWQRFGDLLWSTDENPSA
jgi:hypothetical protein